ncbi:MAG: AIR synthase-related protein, partial [Eubacteriales bacterium]
MAVKRIFVKKKKGFDIAAKNLLHDLKETLNISSLEDLSVLIRYDVEGMDAADFEKAVKSIFSEPMVDEVFLENHEETGTCFAVEYLPGQYDQRADSAAQCIQLLTMKTRPNIATATVYALSGDLTDAEVKAIQDYIINPVDTRLASNAPRDHLAMDVHAPDPVALVKGFTDLNDVELKQMIADFGFAMKFEDLKFTQGYFKEEGRDPYIAELRVIDTYWSDHCRHTTFLTQLDEISFGDDAANAKVKQVYGDYLDARETVYKGRKAKDICLMDMATIYTKFAKKQGLLAGLDESEEINACSIKKDITVNGKKKPYIIMFKNETHNHPTEIEPFGGAATCLGGAIRDPLSGRTYVYQAMRVTGAGDITEPISATMENKLPQKKISTEAAHGYSSYGNQIGLATGLVDEIFHPGYKAKRMEIGAVIAAAPAENVIRECPERDDIVLMLGGRTGRDGIGGATGSSKSHDDTSITECGAEVQKGNPLTERKLQRLFRNPEFSQRIKRCNDFGAGGVCVAVGELTDGLDIDLDAVPKKYEGLNGTELCISESQERMAVVIEKSDLETVLKLAEAENLEAVKIADVTDTARMRM